MRARIVAFGVVLASGCTGMTLGEHQPGNDTWLEPELPSTADGGTAHAVGAVAVEPEEGHVWLLHEESRNGVARAQLTAVDPVSGAAVPVLDMTGAEDRRVVFAADHRALAMGQADGAEHLVLLDAQGLTPLAHATKTAIYNGTRVSPSRRFLAVADNSLTTAPIHVVDMATLEHAVVPHGGDRIEAMWSHQADALLAVSQQDGTDVVRLLRWRVEAIEPWPTPDIDVSIAGYGFDGWFSFTWIGVSSDDRYVVFPLIRTDHPDSRYELVILDQSDGTTRSAPGRGPVGFTPDGSSIVSYGYDDAGGALLYLIDVVTLAVTQVDLPIKGGLSYFVTWDGSFVVCTGSLYSGQLVIYEPGTGRSSTVADAYLDLDDFVTRPGHHELWLDEVGTLDRLALDTGELTSVPLEFSVGHLNILPSQDRLVLAPDTGGTLRFLQMATQKVDRTVELPRPFDSTARGTLLP